MSVVDILTVRLTGFVDQEVLDRVCEELQLDAEGRLGDDWDDKFGTRWLRPESEGVSWLDLYRDTDTEWDVEVSAEPPLPTAAEIAALREQIFAAARKVHLTAEQTYLRAH